MSLIDELAGKTFDTAVEGRRTRRARIEVFRGELVDDLSRYSEHIEQVRIAFNRLRDELERKNRQLEIPWNVQTLSTDDYELNSEFMVHGQERLKDLDLLNRKNSNEAQQFSSELQNLLMGVEVTRTRLEDSWARVRTLLDDSVEVKAVQILRRFRHDLRHLVDFALDSVAKVNVVPRDPTLRQAALTAVDQVLAAADVWNAEVTSVRQKAKEARHLGRKKLQYEPSLPPVSDAPSVREP